MKKILVTIITLCCLVMTTYALVNGFSIDSSKLSYSVNSKNDAVLETFNDKYELKKSIASIDEETAQEVENITKKVTYLLIGDFNNNNESNEEFYKRRKEYLEMGAYQTFPKDENSKSGYDESIENYNYALVSEFAVPSMFTKFSELNVLYNQYGDIKINNSGNLVVSTIYLPKIKMKEENEINPMKYDWIETDLAITYYFLKVNNQYKLAYLYGETGEEISEYFTNLEENENSGLNQMASTYDAKLREIYDYSKLDSISNNQINNIYNNNQSNVVVLNSYYNNNNVGSANGFFINEGIIVTTWTFLKRSLVEAQYIAIKDNLGNTYVLDGIITANPETNIAVLKLKDKIERKVSLGNSKELNIEDPVLTITSKTGLGLTTQKGIIISNEGYIQSTIPLTISDEGSPLIDMNGNVIGMNTAEQINSSTSLALNSEILSEIQNMLSKENFSDIKSVSFEELKEQFYYVEIDNELMKNNIPEKKWKEFSKIGNIEETIKLKLLKASYKDNTISLRYENNVKDFINGMSIVSNFRNKLKEEGYKELLKSNKKCIYKNDKYQIIIMEEFNYLIVVMVKL